MARLEFWARALTSGPLLAARVEGGGAKMPRDALQTPGSPGAVCKLIWVWVSNSAKGSVSQRAMGMWGVSQWPTELSVSPSPFLPGHGTWHVDLHSP